MKDYGKYYNNLILQLNNAVIREINSVFYDLILKISQNIAYFPNRNTNTNKILKQNLINLRQQLVDDLKLLTKKYIEIGQSKAIIKNEQMLKDYLKGFNVSKFIKENLDKIPLKIEFQVISDKIWKYTQPYFQQIEILLNAGLMDGLPAKEIAKDLRKLLKNPNSLSLKELNELFEKDIISKVEYNRLAKKIAQYKPGRGIYKSAKRNAQRLAQNEINLAYRRKDFQIVQKFEFVRGWLVQISGQHPRTDMCDDLAGEYPKKFQFSGWHPACICFVTPILAPIKKTAKLLQGQYADIKPIKDMPVKATKWVSKNKERINKAKNRPYWIKDNKKYVNKFL